MKKEIKCIVSKPHRSKEVGQFFNLYVIINLLFQINNNQYYDNDRFAFAWEPYLSLHLIHTFLEFRYSTRVKINSYVAIYINKTCITLLIRWLKVKMSGIVRKFKSKRKTDLVGPHSYDVRINFKKLQRNFFFPSSYVYYIIYIIVIYLSLYCNRFAFAKILFKF